MLLQYYYYYIGAITDYEPENILAIFELNTW
jgi:hypothetical protein